MGDFRVGFSTLNVNPPLGIGMAGYYKNRHARGLLDDIQVKTMVFEKNNKKVVLVSLDACKIINEFYEKTIDLIEKNTDIKKDEVFLSGTHTHTGPIIQDTPGIISDLEVVETYERFVSSRILDSVKLAIFDLKPAKMGYIVGYAPERVAYIRRYKMKDGTTMTCPPIEDPNIDYPIGILDQRVNVLRFDRENADSIVLVNYGLHADTTGGDLLSADWPYWMSKTLDKALDGVKCIFVAGAEGDVGSTNVFPKDGDMNDTEISFDNEMKSPGMARFVGRALAGTVLQVYDKVKYVDVDDIGIIVKDLKVPSNMPTKEQLPLAKKYKELYEAGRDDLIPFEAMQLTTVVAEAVRMCKLEHGPEEFGIKLSGIKIGPVALIGIAGEPFTDIGVGIKDTPGFELILPCGLTNGHMGYFPMQSAYDEGGYEARCSMFKAGVGERIIKGGKDLIRELYEK